MGGEAVLLEAAHRARAERAWIVHPEPAGRTREHVEHRPDLVAENLADDHPRSGSSRRVARRIRSLTVTSPSPSADGGLE